MCKQNIKYIFEKLHLLKWFQDCKRSQQQFSKSNKSFFQNSHDFVSMVSQYYKLQSRSFKKKHTEIFPFSAPNLNSYNLTGLTLFKIGLLKDRGQKIFLPTTFYTRPKMMNFDTVIPYLRKNQKTYKLRDTPLEFCWREYFFTRNQQLLFFKKYRYRLHFNT